MASVTRRPLGLVQVVATLTAVLLLTWVAPGTEAYTRTVKYQALTNTNSIAYQHSNTTDVEIPGPGYHSLWGGAFGGVLFRGIDIPQGALVVDAVLSFDVRSLSNYALINVYTEDVDNAAEFALTPNEIVERSTVYAGGSYIGPTGGRANGGWWSMGVKVGFEALLNREMWLPGGSMFFSFAAYEFTPGPGDAFAAAQYGIVFLESDGGTKIKLSEIAFYDDTGAQLPPPDFCYGVWTSEPSGCYVLFNGITVEEPFEDINLPRNAQSFIYFSFASDVTIGSYEVFVGSGTSSADLPTAWIFLGGDAGSVIDAQDSLIVPTGGAGSSYGNMSVAPGSLSPATDLAVQFQSTVNNRDWGVELLVRYDVPEYHLNIAFVVGENAPIDAYFASVFDFLRNDLLVPLTVVEVHGADLLIDLNVAFVELVVISSSVNSNDVGRRAQFQTPVFVAERALVDDFDMATNYVQSQSFVDWISVDPQHPITRTINDALDPNWLGGGWTANTFSTGFAPGVRTMGRTANYNGSAHMLLAEAGDMLNSGLASVGAVVATPIEETVPTGGLTVAGRTYIMRAITYITTFLVLDTPVPASVYYREPGPTIVMRVTDHVGNTKDNDSETVIRLFAFNSLYDPVPLNGTVSVTAVNGVVTFDDYQINVAGETFFVAECNNTRNGVDGAACHAGTTSSFAAIGREPTLAVAISGLSTAGAVVPGHVDLYDQHGTRCFWDSTTLMSVSMPAFPGLMFGVDNTTCVAGGCYFENVSTAVGGDSILFRLQGYSAGGAWSTDLYGSVVRVAPNISSVSPSVGPESGGTLITIVGDALGYKVPASVMSVTVGSVPCTNVTVVEMHQPSEMITRLTCVTGVALATGPAAVYVNTTLNIDPPDPPQPGNFNYAVTSQAIVTGVDPTAGPTAGGTVVTVTGSSFGVTPSAVSVTIGGINCTVVDASQVASGIVTCETGAFLGPATSQKAVIVTTALGAGLSSASFTYAMAPVVASLAPSTVAANVSGLVLEIDGTDLGLGTSDVVSVTAGGIHTCSAPEVTDAGLLTCALPPLPTVGDLDVVVTTVAGGASDGTPRLEVVGEVAMVTSVDPWYGPTTGRQVNVSVAHVGDLDGIFFGGALASTQLIGSSWVIVDVQPGMAGEVVVSATSVSAGAGLSIATFEFLPLPQIASVSPAQASANQLVEVAIRVNGENLAFGSGDSVTVTVGGVVCAPDGAPSTTRVPCQLDLTTLAPGNHNVTLVSAAHGEATLVGGFRVVGAPVITSVDPTAGGISGNTLVRLDGSDLGKLDDLNVTIGGVACRVISHISPKLVFCRTDPRFAGSGTFSIIAATGAGIGGGGNFTYLGCESGGSTCDSCVAVDPLCGYCVGSANCLQSAECPGDTPFLVTCPFLSNPSPASTSSFGGGEVSVTLAGADDLPATGYECEYDFGPSVDGSLNDGNLTCPIPANSAGGQAVVTVFNEAFEVGTFNLTYVDCRATGSARASSCSACAAAPECTWCAPTALCGGAPQCASNQSVAAVDGCPTVTAVQPSSGPNTGGVVTVVGDNFDVGLEVTCRYGDLPGQGFVVSPTEIECTVPGSSGTVGPLVVAIEVGASEYAGNPTGLAYSLYDCAAVTGGCESCYAEGDRCLWCGAPLARCTSDVSLCPDDPQPAAGVADRADFCAAGSGDASGQGAVGLGAIGLVGIGLAGLALLAVIFVVVWLVACRPQKRERSQSALVHGDDGDRTRVAADDAIQRKVTAMLKSRKAERIGGGVVADVFKTVVKKGGDDVCVKVLKKRFENDPVASESFHREVRALSRLVVQEHPAICRLLFFSSASPVAIGLEYCAGGSLKHAIRSGTAANSPEERTRICFEIAAGMAVVRAHSIAHLDLKTDNVLLDAAGHAKVCDFGISHFCDAAGRAVEAAGASGFGGGVECTPHYVAPERIVEKARAVDLFMADVFSFGSLASAVLTGGEPYDGEDGDIVLESIRLNPNRRPPLPSPEESTEPFLATMVAACWNEVPSERPEFSALEADLRDRIADEYGGDDGWIPFEPTDTTRVFHEASGSGLNEGVRASAGVGSFAAPDVSLGSVEVDSTLGSGGVLGDAAVTGSGTADDILPPVQAI